MPWVTRETMNAFPNASQILVDESLGHELAPALQKITPNAREVVAVKLNGNCDEDGRRIFLTEDREFLDDRKFPPHRYAGLVVFVGEHDGALIKSLMSALSLVERGRELWEGAKIAVGGDGRVAVTSYDRNTGERQTSHYKLRLTGPPLVWISKESLATDCADFADEACQNTHRSQELSA